MVEPVADKLGIETAQTLLKGSGRRNRAILEVAPSGRESPTTLIPPDHCAPHDSCSRAAYPCPFRSRTAWSSPPNKHHSRGTA